VTVAGPDPAQFYVNISVFIDFVREAGTTKRIAEKGDE
jgi:hypothetical protein